MTMPHSKKQHVDVVPGVQKDTGLERFPPSAMPPVIGYDSLNHRRFGPEAQYPAIMGFPPELPDRGMQQPMPPWTGQNTPEIQRIIDALKGPGV